MLWEQGDGARTVLHEAEAAGAHGVPEEDVVHESATPVAHCAGGRTCQALRSVMRVRCLTTWVARLMDGCKDG